MKQNIIAILFILSFFCGQAQLEMRINPYIKGEIVLKNDSIKKGYIKLDDSAFRIRFKKSKEQKLKEKINYKDIRKIILFSDSPSNRVFFYKKTDADKFLKFVELIYSNTLDVYIYSPDNLSLFYSGIDRSNVADWVAHARSEISRFNVDSAQRLEDLKNGTNTSKPIIQAKRISYSKIRENLSKAKNTSYLIYKKGLEKLNFIYSNKKLKKFAILNFNECSELILKIKNKEFKKDDIVEIVDFYNNCVLNEIEKK